MAQTKIDRFLTKLTKTVNTVDSTTIKWTLGDSTDNNRVVSVRQLIRFLSEGTRTERKFANEVDTIYNIVRPSLQKVRSEVLENSRTDAFDVNEFVALVSYLANEVTFRRIVGKEI